MKLNKFLNYFLVFLVIFLSIITTLTCYITENIEINDINQVLVPEITNASHHMHPWLATTISILFLSFIVFIIILCGDKAG